MTSKNTRRFRASLFATLMLLLIAAAPATLVVTGHLGWALFAYGMAMLAALVIIAFFISREQVVGG